MSVVDVLVWLEVALMIAAIPAAIVGTWRLVKAVRRSTRPDHLARVITVYLATVTVAALWVGLLLVYRALTGIPAANWTRPITGLLVLIILLGPWYISRVARS